MQAGDTEQTAALLETARAAARDAGSAIMNVYLSGNFGTTSKQDDSPLTLADKAAHQVIAEYLHKTGLPVLSEEGAPIDFEERKNWDYYWLVDPLDGTKEFLKQNGEFTVNIALMRRHMPVAGVVFAPVTGNLYFGATGAGAHKEKNGETTALGNHTKNTTIEELQQKSEITIVASRSHLTPETVEFVRQFPDVQFTTMGSSLKLMLLAENKADIYPRFAPTMEWDTAAAHAILLALGKGIYQTDLKSQLTYNKPDLLNPSFISF